MTDNKGRINEKNRKKVMVIDDSALMRRVMCDILEADGRFIIEDICTNGLDAFNLLKEKTYDIVITDIVMPKMTGLELLEKLQNEGINANVVVASTLSQEGAKETLRALELGAVEFVPKPLNFIEARGEDFAKQVRHAVEAAANTSASLSTKRKTSVPKEAEATTPKKEAVATAPAKPAVSVDKSKLRTTTHAGAKAKTKIVALACSTGGPKALQSVVPFLPANLDAPVLIVQHMPEGFTAMMAQKLNGLSHMKVKEAAEGDLVTKGTVYVAPGGKHMNVARNGNEYRIKLTDEPIREGVKPCANYMYESLINSNYEEITCVVLTGMGADGTAGIKALAKEKNIYCISQDQASCVVYGMPKAIFEAGLVNEVVPLDEVVGAIVKNVGVM